MKGIFFCCVLAIWMTSCKSAKESVSLTGVKWVAESLNGKEIKFKEGGSEVFITLETVIRKYLEGRDVIAFLVLTSKRSRN